MKASKPKGNISLNEIELVDNLAIEDLSRLVTCQLLNVLTDKRVIEQIRLAWTSLMRKAIIDLNIEQLME